MRTNHIPRENDYKYASPLDLSFLEIIWCFTLTVGHLFIQTVVVMSFWNYCISHIIEKIFPAISARHIEYFDTMAIILFINLMKVIAFDYRYEIRYFMILEKNIINKLQSGGGGSGASV